MMRVVPPGPASAAGGWPRSPDR